MSAAICERCKRETWVTFSCQSCHKHVCIRCIVSKDDRQLCRDCADTTEEVRADEPEPVLA